MTNLTTQSCTLKEFNFSYFTNDSARLIAEYYQSTPTTPSTTTQTPSDQVVSVDSRVQTAVQSCWSQIWHQKLESEQWVMSWARQRVVEFCQEPIPQDQPFKNAIRFMLVEMAEAPAERIFLADLSQALRTKDQILCIERDVIYRLSRFADGKVHKIGVSLEESDRELFADPHGTLYIQQIPSRRFFTQALITVYNRVLETFDLETFPKTLRWRTGETMMSICGRGKTTTGQTKVAQYCENAFAQKRGEMARMTSVLITYPAEESSQAMLLLHALIHGASGTVQQLFRANRSIASEITMRALFQAYTITNTGYKTSNAAEDAELYEQILNGKVEACDFLLKELKARAIFFNQALINPTFID